MVATGSRTRSDYKALTRQRLADAAVAEFEAVGYARCRIDDVARRAGTSRATFYAHFDSKVQPLEGMWDVVRRRLTALFRQLARAECRDAAFVEAWLLRTFDFYRDNRRRLMAIHEAIALEPELAEVYFERTSELAALVAPLIRPEHVLSSDGARFRAALLTMQHERFCYFWIIREMPFDGEEAVQNLTQVWLEHVAQP